MAYEFSISTEKADLFLQQLHAEYNTQFYPHPQIVNHAGIEARKERDEIYFDDVEQRKIEEEKAIKQKEKLLLMEEQFNENTQEFNVDRVFEARWGDDGNLHVDLDKLVGEGEDKLEAGKTVHIKVPQLSNDKLFNPDGTPITHEIVFEGGGSEYEGINEYFHASNGSIDDDTIARVTYSISEMENNHIRSVDGYELASKTSAEINGPTQVVGGEIQTDNGVTKVVVAAKLDTVSKERGNEDIIIYMEKTGKMLVMSYDDSYTTCLTAYSCGEIITTGEDKKEVIISAQNIDAHSAELAEQGRLVISSAEYNNIAAYYENEQAYIDMSSNDIKLLIKEEIVTRKHFEQDFGRPLTEDEIATYREMVKENDGKPVSSAELNAELERQEAEKMGTVLDGANPMITLKGEAEQQEHKEGHKNPLSPTAGDVASANISHEQAEKNIAAGSALEQMG